MEKFTTLNSPIVPLQVDNIDTDQIIPARFLKSSARTGFGENLFRDWRYDQQGKPNPDFILNDSTRTGSILLAGKNFGCGSSREHAAWALQDFGFKVVIASSFADIFRNNALNNGLLPIELSEQTIDNLFQLCRNNPSAMLTINLEKQVVLAPSARFPDEEVISFQVNNYKKQCLLNGQDDLGFLFGMMDQIHKYEESNPYCLSLQHSNS